MPVLSQIIDIVEQLGLDTEFGPVGPRIFLGNPLKHPLPYQLSIVKETAKASSLVIHVRLSLSVQDLCSLQLIAFS